MDENKSLPEHIHCRTCGKAIPPDKTFCSEECRQRFADAVRKQRRQAWIMMVIILVAFAGVVIAALLV
jgi:predicted nucleic acid-binding Zn ribbon protein